MRYTHVCRLLPCLVGVCVTVNGQTPSPAAPAESSNATQETATFAAQATDGSQMMIEVDCGTTDHPVVRLKHPALDGLPLIDDPRPGSSYDRAASVIFGWGLDLDRHDHHGARYYLYRRCGTGCLVARAPKIMIEALKRNYSVHVLIETGIPVSARFDLTGSRRRIEAVCS